VKNSLVLRVQRNDHVEETTLGDATTNHDVRLVELDADDAPDLVVDGGDTRKGVRFHVYPTAKVLGAEDRLVWYWLVDAKSIDEAVNALQGIPRIDYSIPEVCGLLEHAQANETWRWSEEDGWRRDPRARRLSNGACSALTPDGQDAYWMTELACSSFAPACEIQLLSGGHGGTMLPQESYVFFERVKGKLRLRAFAANEH
jgi:hypothetical protein